MSAPPEAKPTRVTAVHSILHEPASPAIGPFPNIYFFQHLPPPVRLTPGGREPSPAGEEGCRVAASEDERLLADLRAGLLTVPVRWSPELIGLTSLPQASARLDRLVDELMRKLSAPDLRGAA